MKKLLALLLVLCLFISVLPTAFAAPETGSEGIWETICEIEDRNIRRVRGKAATEQDYAAIVDLVVDAVEASSSYKKGTLERHGDFFFWETLDGEPNGYSPRLRARIREHAVSDADPEDFSSVETVSYAKRNSPDGTAVAVFQPYYGLDSSFTNQYKTEGESIAKATGGICTTYRTTNATIDAIADALESCAVVIFDSHGDTDYMSGYDYTSRANTSYLLLQTNSGWTTADQTKVSGTYGSYYHAYNSGSDGKMHYYCADGTAITNHMEKTAPNNLLWMAICLGMATDGMNAPMREHGVGVVYGYSQSVTFDGDYLWEENFWNSMEDGKTVSAAISKMKTECGSWDYSREMYNAYGWKIDSDCCTTITQAKRNDAAFPIVVSAEDAYPGHGKVDDLQTVASTWTLMSSVTPTYNFTARSNNTDLGTVSVSGNVITAQAKMGCEITGFSVSPEGAANVSRNGTSFTVTDLTADCTVTINFRRKTTYTVTYSVPVGVSCASSSCYEGSSVKLAEPAGKPTAAPDAVFCGWSQTAVEKTDKQPAALLSAGSEFTPYGNLTLYAVYRDTMNGATYYSSEPAQCTHANTELRRTAASCTEDGLEKLVCLDCGSILSETPISALGHDFVDGICSRCGEEGPDVPPVHDCPCDDYDDLYKTQWYHEGVDYALDNGLMNGMGERIFNPDGSLTRAMLVTILYRLEKEPSVEGMSNPFTDVPENQWYTEAVIWAADQGIVNGMTETTFAPNASITREQIAAILYRYAGKPAGSGDLNGFADASSVSPYAVDAMAWAVGEGIIGGMDGSLAPKDNATRVQIATILYRYLTK